MKLGKTIVIGVVSLVMAASLFAAGAKEEGAQPAPQQTGEGVGPRYGGTFVIAVNSEPGGLNPILWQGAEPSISSSGIFNALIRLDKKGGIVGDLAQSWEVSDDGRVYTFHLLRGVKWHDGEPFTSADVLYTVMGSREGYMVHSRYLPAIDSLVESYQAPDDYTFVFKLKRPFAPFLTLLAEDRFGPRIVPRHIYEGTDVKKNQANWAPIGTGPFKFKEWVRGDHIELVRNDDYFKKGLPYIDRQIIRFMPDENARMLALEKGEVDFLYFYLVPYSAVPELRKNPDIVISEEGATAHGQVQMWIFNLLEPPFDKLEARQAVAYALDKQKINSTVYFGLARPAYSINGKDNPFFNEDVVEKYETGSQDRDIERANQLLDQAGYSRGQDGVRFKTTLLYMSGRPYAGKVGEVAREDLRKVGIELDMLPIDRPTFIERIFSRWDFDVSSQQFSAGPHPYAGIPRYIKWSQHKAGVYPSNAMGYNNPRVESLFEQSTRVKTEEEQAQIWAEVQKTISEDLPVLPIVEMPYTNAWRAEWRDVMPGIDGVLRAGGESVWWTKGELR